MPVHHWERGPMTGDPFSHCLATDEHTHDFPLVEKVEVWHGVAGYNVLGGIRVHYNNGSASPVCGSPHNGVRYEFKLEQGEYITSMSQGEGAPEDFGNGLWISSIRLWTNRNRSWQVDSSQYMYDVTIHSGFLLGISGRFGPDSGCINRLGYYFLESLKNMTVDFEFLDQPNPAYLTLKYFDTETITNDTELPQPGHISREKSVTNSAISEEGWTEEMGVNVSVKTGFFGIGESEMGAEWKVTTHNSSSTSYEETDTLRWAADPVVPPGKIIDVEMFHFEGYFNLRYKATVTLFGKSGSQYTTTKTGFMQGETSSVTKINYKQRDLNSPSADSGHTIDEDIPFNKLPPNTK